LVEIFFEKFLAEGLADIKIKPYDICDHTNRVREVYEKILKAIHKFTVPVL